MSHTAGAALVLCSVAMPPRAFAQETHSKTVQTAVITMPRPGLGITTGTPRPVPRGNGHYTLPDAGAVGGGAGHGLWPVVVGNDDGNPIIEYQMPPR
jgi:hypothetical protein